LIPELLDEILIRLLDSISFQEPPRAEQNIKNAKTDFELEPPEYGAATIKQVIEKIANGFRNGDIQFLFCKSPYVYFNL